MFRLKPIFESYEKFFGEPKPKTLEEIIRGIPSKPLIVILSFLNAETHFKDPGGTIQKDIFHFLLRKFPPNKSAPYLNYLRWYFDRFQEYPMFFHTQFTTEFLHQVFLDYKEGDIPDVDNDQMERILRAYVWIIDALVNTQSKILERDAISYGPIRGNSVYSSAWAPLMFQWELTTNVDPFVQVLKALSLLRYFSTQTNYEKYLNNFLVRTRSTNIQQFALDFLNLIISVNNHPPDTNFEVSSFVNPPSQFIPLLERLSIDPNEYSSSIGQAPNYKGLKKFPLYRYSENRFFVLNWKFFNRKIYTGLLFDLFENSGIQEIHQRFDQFFGIISNDFFEHYPFRNLITKIFKTQKAILYFDDQSERGMPDAYCRYGKYIFLLEFKNSIFKLPEESWSFDHIKNEIDQKLLFGTTKDKKGVSQLVSQLNIMEKGGFRFDRLDAINISKKSITVFPILIVNDFQFMSDGINHYLTREFRKMLREGNYSFRIKDTVVISFDFLVENFHYFQSNPKIIKKSIDSYLAYLNNLVLIRENSRDKRIDLNELRSFEDFIIKKIPERNQIKNKDQWLRELFEIFELNDIHDTSNKA